MVKDDHYSEWYERQIMKDRIFIIESEMIDNIGIDEEGVRTNQFDSIVIRDLYPNHRHVGESTNSKKDRKQFRQDIHPRRRQSDELMKETNVKFK